MSKQRRALGRLGEELAASYLMQQGYRVLERNYRCRLGEIDIIAVDGPALVFVEVRSLASENYGLPQESIQWRKQKKLRNVAQYYLQSTGLQKIQFRFDVVAIVFDHADKIKHLEHIKNAF